MLPDLELNLVGQSDDFVADTVEFNDWLTRQLATREPIAIDTETCGLDWWEPNFTRLVQFGSDRSGWALPVDWCRKLIDHALSRIRDSLVPVVMHNATFDMHALESDGFTVPLWSRVQDTMILHHLAQPLRSHALKNIAKHDFGRWAVTGQDALKGVMAKNKWDWTTVPVDNPYYWGYGVCDTILTRMVYDKYVSHDWVDKDAYEREMAYLEVMYRVEQRGLRIDLDYCRSLSTEWETKLRNLYLCLKDAGISNPHSNAEIEKAFKELGWHPQLFTETGKAQLDKSVLDAIANMPSHIATHARQLIEFRRLSKWKSTYLDTFLSSVDGDGRVHPSIKTMGARTGRSSITNPPLQTLPHTPHIRSAVIPDDGSTLYAVDYSGQEYRILASYSKDEAWLDEFTNGQADPHTMVSKMLGIKRDQAKTFNFAMVYGAGPAKLAQGTGLTEHEVKLFLNTYKQKFPQIYEFINNLQRVGAGRMSGEGHAYVVTRGGRKVESFQDQMYALTNYLIQGSGADVLKEAVCRLDKAGLADHILLPVHDELLFDIPCQDSEETVKEIVDIMTNDDWFNVPIVAEAEGPFNNWGDKYV